MCTWCYWKSRDVIQAENLLLLLLLLLSWFDRAQKDDISILYILNFSHFTYNSNLSVSLYLSKQRPTFFSIMSAHCSQIHWLLGAGLGHCMQRLVFKCCSSVERVWKRLWTKNLLIKILVTLSHLAAKHKERKIKGSSDGEHKQQCCKC